MSYKDNSVSMIPAIFNPKTGAPTNHHCIMQDDGSYLIGERVKYDEAECLIVTQTHVIDVRRHTAEGE